MLHVILFRPEIPPNTGNVIRLCANTGAALHLIRPLGFELDDARLRRAGLDYHEYARIALHDDLAGCLAAIGAPRVFAFTTRGRVAHVEVRFADGDALLFGCETAGLPEDVLQTIPAGQRLRLPMCAAAYFSRTPGGNPLDSAPKSTQSPSANSARV